MIAGWKSWVWVYLPLLGKSVQSLGRIRVRFVLGCAVRWAWGGVASLLGCFCGAGLSSGVGLAVNWAT